MYHVHGAVLDAQGASNALIRINLHHALRGPRDGIHRAHLHAVGIFTLAAHHRQMVQVFAFVADIQPGAPGVESAGERKAACQLADAASGAFVKMGMDKRGDSSLLFGNFGYEISHIMYYVNVFLPGIKMYNRWRNGSFRNPRLFLDSGGNRKAGPQDPQVSYTADPSPR